MKEWDKLKVFYHVAELSSISKAAVFLGITQPSVSRTIGLLEERIGATLFERVPRGVKLTREGHILYEHASKIFQQVDAAIKFIDGKEDYSEGKLKILTTHGLSYSWIAYLMPEFMAQYPDIRPVITGDDREFNLVHHDIAILPFKDNSPNLVQEHIATFRMKLFASQSYIDKFGSPENFEDLKSHQLIIYGDAAPNRHGPLSALVKSAHPPFIQINSAQGRLNLAKLGMGIAELGEDYPIREGLNLVEILPDIEPATSEYYCIYPKTMQNSQRIMSLVNFLKTIKK